MVKVRAMIYRNNLKNFLSTVLMGTAKLSSGINFLLFLLVIEPPLQWSPLQVMWLCDYVWANGIGMG